MRTRKISSVPNANKQNTKGPQNTKKSSGKTARERERERERETIPLFIFYTSEKEIYTRN
jgi:hypothetical protein